MGRKKSGNFRRETGSTRVASRRRSSKTGTKGGGALLAREGGGEEEHFVRPPIRSPLGKNAFETPRERGTRSKQ